MLFMNWLSDLLGGMYEVVDSFLTFLFFWIARILYPFISYLYSLFEILIKGRLLDNGIMKILSNRIGLLLGIIMFFIVIVNAIQMLVDPDKMNDKEKGAGSIIIRVFVVLVMFGLSSFAFDTLYHVQEIVVDSNVVGRLFIPSEIQTDEFGDYLSFKLFTAFYRINPYADSNDSTVVLCKGNIAQLEADVYARQDFKIAKDCVFKEDSNGEDIIEFNFILSIGAAVFCIYFLFTYCVTIGVRMVQLTFLEIMSPMAFVAYLSPKKDNMFNKWFKLYTSTFVDSFIRIAIINFAVYLIALILGDMSDGSAFFDTIVNSDFVRNNYWAIMFIYVIMLFAILTFAKKAPDLLKELFPAGASKLGLGVTSTKQLFSNMIGDGNIVKRAWGMGAVGFNAWQQNVRKATGNLINGKKEDRGKNALRLANSVLTGGLGGMTRGVMTTNKSQRTTAAANAYAAKQAKYKMKDLGYNFLDKAEDKIRSFGMQDQYIEDMAAMKDLEVETLRQSLSEYRQRYGKYAATISVAKSVKGEYKYIYNSPDGPVFINKDGKGADGRVYVSGDALNHGLFIANSEEKIGKAQADSKKLHQKAEEQKSKNNKS